MNNRQRLILAFLQRESHHGDSIYIQEQISLFFRQLKNSKKAGA
jgi:hypothetical protein